MYAGVFLLSVATLSLEIGLTRVFSLTQWYHFAFMAVAVALLGFGASGSLLAVIGQGDGRKRASLASIGFAVAALLLYPAINIIPFDAYRLALDREQVIYLMLYVLALAAPFLASGLALGALLSAYPQNTGRIYGVNLAGSGAGCLLALVILGSRGERAMPGLVAAIALAGAALFTRSAGHRRVPVLVCCTAAAALALGLQPPAVFAIRLSPYKALSIISSFQGSYHVLSRSNAFSRVDVVEGPAVRSAPGLSMAFRGRLPVQPGLTVDGSNLHIIPTTSPTDAASAYADYLPTAVPFRLRPGARVLVVQAGAGSDVLLAWRQQAAAVTAVEANPLIVQTARDMGATVYGSQTRVIIDNGRSFLAASLDVYDIILISLVEGFRPVTSGDFSLSENYIYTVEAFVAFYGHLAPDGLLVVTRWAQWPPSEDVRLAAIAAAALRRAGVADPAQHVVAYRSFQTLTMAVRRGPFSADDIAVLRRLWQDMGYDPVYFPGMSAADANRFVVLPDTRHYDAFAALLEGKTLVEQTFDVSPSTDDRPFFFHFFHWNQAGQILRNLGKTWQPFGGAGYLVLIAFLFTLLLTSLLLILVPLLVRRQTRGQWWQARPRRQRLWLVYFVLLGLGFLLVEIPLMQRYILFLGQPVYATAVVLFSLLTASGAGSVLSSRLGRQGHLALLAIAGAALAYPVLLSFLFTATLGLPFAARLLVAALSLAPLGVLLGVPFPWAMRRVEERLPGFVPWAWAANGCASVISSVLAAMVAVSGGFTAVLVGAAVAYGLAWGVSRASDVA